MSFNSESILGGSLDYYGAHRSTDPILNEQKSVYHAVAVSPSQVYSLPSGGVGHRLFSWSSG